MMTQLRVYALRFTLLASLWTLSGCAAIGPSYPTPIPPEVLPTAIAQTAAALNATALALTPSPTVTASPTVTPTPTITNTLIVGTAIGTVTTRNLLAKVSSL